MKLIEMRILMCAKIKIYDIYKTVPYQTKIFKFSSVLQNSQNFHRKDILKPGYFCKKVLVMPNNGF